MIVNSQMSNSHALWKVLSFGDGYLGCPIHHSRNVLVIGPVKQNLAAEEISVKNTVSFFPIMV